MSSSFSRNLRKTAVFSALFALVILGLLSVPQAARAQLATASINGTVRDATGAVVPDATVTLTSVATNVEQSINTHDDGTFVIVKIEPGRYTLKVTKAGFQTEIKPEFDLDVNQTVTLDFSMKVGANTQVVTVQAQATGIQTSTAELGTVIARQSVDSLPLNGRNFTQLLDLTPGVSSVNVSQNASNQQFDGNTVGTYSFPAINGQSNRSNLFLLDGINDQESFASTYSVAPIVDTIQEFKVDTHNDQAAFGGVLGGVINVVTKSGTNSFHGEGWGFARNSLFDANSDLGSTAQLHQYQYGVDAGGPVVFPHYNGRNKTFFFGAYEGSHIHSVSTSNNVIPTTAELTTFNFNGTGAGTIGSTATCDVSPVPAKCDIYNPWSTTATGARTQFQCASDGVTPLAPNAVGIQPAGTPCNVLPSASNPATQAACTPTAATGPNVPGCVDANMLKVAQMMYGVGSSGLLATPNTACAASIAATDNYCDNLLTIQDTNTFTGRMDEELTSKDTLWFRYSYANAPRNVPNIFGAVNDNSYYAHDYGATWNHTFGSSSVLTVAFGRNHAQSLNPTLLSSGTASALNSAGGYATSWDCGYIPVAGGRPCYFNSVDMITNSLASFQEGTSPAVVANIFEGRVDLSKTHGRHTFTMGVDISSNGFTQTFNASHEDFSNLQTGSTNSSSTGGYAFASFLLGIPNGATYRNEFETEYGAYEFGFYFEDSWRVTDKLTLNLGGRYDISTVPRYGSPADNNTPIGNFNLNNGTYAIQYIPLTCSATGGVAPCIPGNPPACAYSSNTLITQPINAPCLPAGITASSGLLPNNVVVSSDELFWHTAYDNIQPRVGIAYRVLNRTVIRGSVGRFFDNWAAVIQMAQNQQGGWPRTDQFIVTDNQNPGPPNVFAENPLLGANTSPAAVPFNQNNWYVDPNLKNPYSWQWNFGVQEALTSTTTLTVNYVGSTDRRLDVGLVGNEAVTPGPGVVPVAGCYFEAPTTTGSCDPQVIAAEGRFPYPYMDTFHYDRSIGEAWYDAMQVTLDKSVGHGLSYIVSYTWSRSEDLCADEWFGTGTNGTSCEDSYDITGHSNKSVSGFDIPQILRISGVYLLPFGQGKFSTGSRVVNSIIGGWQINEIASIASGTPFTITAATSTLNDGSNNVSGTAYQRANLVSGQNPVLSDPTPQEWFNTAAFSAPAVCSTTQAGYPNSCFGNAPRNYLRSDGTANLDLSIFRNFKVTENQSLQFRAEAFNLFNSPVFGLPNAGVSTPSTFGTVTAMAPTYNPRQMQFAFKYYW